MENALSQTMEATQLPTTLRMLRVGQDDTVHIRRTVHLAAAKIEDLQDQVNRLLTALGAAAPEDALQPAGPPEQAAGGSSHH
jgi:hypothetical protein